MLDTQHTDCGTRHFAARGLVLGDGGHHGLRLWGPNSLILPVSIDLQSTLLLLRPRAPICFGEWTEIARPLGMVFRVGGVGS